MVAQLTKNERQLGMIMLALLAFCGLLMAGLGGGTSHFAIHGFIILLASLGTLFVVISGYYEPEPRSERLQDYYDDPTKVGIFLAMIWAVIGMFMGVWVAALLAFPDMTFDAAWSSFGRLRPIHTTGVI